MTRIRANCPSCGEVDLRPDDVVLKIVRARDGEVTGASSYRFCCPACADLVTKPADGRIAQLLVTGGVPIEEAPAGGTVATSIDHRPTHPESPSGGPALTYDDLLDLHLRLQDHDWFEALLSSSS